MENRIFDLIIVGAGPAGLTAYLYSKRALLDVLIIDKGLPGGQVLITDFIENYPGFPEGISGFELIEKFKAQVEKLGWNFLQEEAVYLQDGEIKTIKTANGKELKGKAVILALGASPKKLGVPGEKELTGKGVSYCATCDGPFFREEVVAVVGGGNTALQEALFLTKFAKKVYLIHRRDAFRATPILQKRVKENSKIECIMDSVVEEILGDEKVKEIRILNKKEGKTFTLAVSGVFIFIGQAPQTDWLKGILDLDERGFIKVNARMETSLKGVFACGDCISKDFRQIVIACGEGAVAALSAEHFIESLKK